MATNPPPPNTSPAVVPPTSITTPPPSQSSPLATSPPLPSANPPDSSTAFTPSPLQSPVAPSPPTPQETISPTLPPPLFSNLTSPSSPASNPPVSSPPTSPTISPPPPVSNSPTSSPPPPVTNPPMSSPPAPVSNPPTGSPPPRSPPSPPPTQPPKSPPSPSSDPPTNSPPPSPPSTPPINSPLPTPSVNPPRNSPPPPPTSAPPPPPSAKPPKSSPPAPLAVPPSNAPPPPTQTAPPLLTPPNSMPNFGPPTQSRTERSPPPRIPLPPSENTHGNSSNPSSPDISNSTSNNGNETGGTVVIAVAVAIIACTVIGLVVWCLRRRKKEVCGLNGVYVMPSQLGSSPTSDASFLKSSAPLIGSSPGSDIENSPRDPSGLGNSRSLFTYEELVKATDGFSAQNLLGEGGFGSVYKGYLPDGREVAIKQLKIGGEQGEREFKAEVEIISRIHHRHLVSLVGYCISDNQRLLVYEYVCNGTLYSHLHGEGRPVLDWATRGKIAAGAARGLAYLHEDCHPRIIHRDIKSSNILLDNNFEARVSDFGLAKLALDANTHVSTRVMGTFGYMAPEYASSGKLTEKSDVFSFGVVLLELISGRKPVDASQPLGDESLVEWARPLLSHALENEEFDALADPKLGKNYVESEMFRMIEAAAACVRHSAAKRPGMGQVVRAFNSLAASDLSNGIKVGESEVLNSAQQSAELRWFRTMAFGSQNYSRDFFTQGSLDT